ncbi:MAG: pyridoxamine 5'-phosphate oxidase family protein [Dehalococcoidia bacterium]|nr:pyridoxamine 5'-phosphate oxidase family protein [Dehalococcoidia bacterium]
MIEFTEEMRHAIKNALDDRNVCIVATASADGWPQLAFRGSVAVFSDNELSFWSRSRKDTVPNIEANPKVQIFYRNAAERIAWRFFGQGRNVTDPTEREAVMAVTDQRELDADPERKGIGTIVKIERIVDRTGAVIQQA